MSDDMKRSYCVAQVGIDNRNALRKRRDTGFQPARGRTSAHRDHALQRAAEAIARMKSGQAKFRMVLTMREERDAHQ